MSTEPTCRCGHAREMHRHLRRGTDCALCPRGDCVKFRPAEPVGLVRRLRTALARPTGAAVVRHPSSGKDLPDAPDAADDRPFPKQA